MPLTDSFEAHIESSDEESVGEAIPFHSKEDEEAKPSKDDEKNNEDDESDEDEEGDEDVYVVERVVGHSFDKKGKLQFEVKWKGYDDPADMTVEPEENLLDGAQEVLEEYFKKIGGRPEKPTKKRKSLADKASSTPDKPTKKGRKPNSAKVETPDQEASPEDADWTPPTGDWDNELSYVSTILRDPDGDGLVVYLEWKNGRKSRASLKTCYERCPQKMLQFYEQHLVFKEV
ncbi:heterochromatin protein HP1 [Nannizzia gypsea CBS 118893]|uniref:Heterochromatin protein HP1 n=1 Tax=Arthroderma gypseum (strain ATCC MYA-4604 / CBS 118893) TaxID=535722 RepID=E5R0Y0_ARTGP|nr:heterochromatin protein HP1 [Nannizzia gypsea CBS 118893]EFQ98422.1 heterochromatin protein HP1 [Nannizzia gypsea CBS 118893]